MLQMRDLFVTASLAMVLVAGACRTAGLDQQEAMRELEATILMGMPRDEIEGALQRMELDYLYLPRSLLEAMRQETFESTPLSGRLQVSLPVEKGLFFELVGHALIELDENERMVGIRIERGYVPR